MGGLGFWLLLLAAVVFLFGGCGRGLFGGVGGCGHRPYGPGPRPEDGETPKQILDRRLAKGELSLEEYRRLIEELGRRE